jgi:hypothetical protein
MVFTILPNALQVGGTKHYWQAELESRLILEGT